MVDSINLRKFVSLNKEDPSLIIKAQMAQQEWVTVCCSTMSPENHPLN